MVAIINTIGVVLSVVSDFVSMYLYDLTHRLVLALPIIKVIKLQITSKQKWALIGVFAVGTLVAGIEVIRGAFILAASTTEASVQLNLIWITLQCTLGIVVTNLPILRPLFFTRSFGNHSSTNGHVTNNGTNNNRTWANQQKKGIPLYDVPEYGGHAIVSAGQERKSTENVLEAGMILKSVEVRVHSESVPSSVHSGVRNESKFFD
jgi:hypothetical protein